jgi:hypothetical protein
MSDMAGKVVAVAKWKCVSTQTPVWMAAFFVLDDVGKPIIRASTPGYDDLSLPTMGTLVSKGF